MKDNFSVRGMVHLILRDKDGNIKQDFTIKNMVVSSGFEFIASRMLGTSAPVMSHMAVGTSTTAAGLAQTTLVAESERSAFDSVTRTVASIAFIATFPPSSAFALSEAGIFNAPTAGSMLCRTVFPVVNKQEEDTLTINWTVSIVAP